MCLHPCSWRLVQRDMSLNEGIRRLACAKSVAGVFRAQPLYLHWIEFGGGQGAPQKND